MATRKPLYNNAGVISEITSSDTIPVGNVPVMVGDSGSGGTKGLVPAPAAGDAAAGKVLKADGTWYVPSGLTNPMTTTGDVIYSSNNSGTPARLGVGSDGQVLELASGIPSWADLPVKKYPVTIANATANADTDILKITIDANTWADGQMIEFRWFNQIKNNSGGAVNFTHKLWWNGNSSVNSAISQANSASTFQGSKMLTIFRIGSDIWWTLTNPSNSFTADNFGATAGAILTSQTFTGSSVDLKLSVNWASTGATIFYNVKSAICMKL